MLCFVYNLFFVYTSKLLLKISIGISNLYFRMLCARNLSTSNIYNTYLLDYVSVCGDVTASPYVITAMTALQCFGSDQTCRSYLNYVKLTVVNKLCR